MGPDQWGPALTVLEFDQIGRETAVTIAQPDVDPHLFLTLKETCIR